MMSRIVLFSCISSLVLVLASISLVSAQGPETLTFDTKMGTVTFPHNAHQQYAECNVCHHTGDYTSCTSCHGVNDDAPKARDAFHQLCKNCHQEQQAGPVKCAECHIR